MPDPTINKVRKLGNEKRRKLEQSEKRLRAALRRLQVRIMAFLSKELLSELSKDKEGNIQKTKNNALRLKTNERVRKLVQMEIDKELRKVLNTEFARIKNANDKYYKEFGPSAKVRQRVSKLNRRLISQFKRRVVEKIDINNRISAIINSGIKNGVQVSELREDLQEFVTGKDKLGALEHFFWKNDGLEQFQVHARTMAESYSKQLNLNYAFYAGGEIKTTREFCDEHNGNVYSRAEIAALGQTDWQGKKEDNNIFRDCGGWNCRHEWDWISKQLAVRVRPELADD